MIELRNNVFFSLKFSSFAQGDDGLKHYFRYWSQMIIYFLQTKNKSGAALLHNKRIYLLS